MNVSTSIGPKPCLCGAYVPASGDDQQEAFPAVPGIGLAVEEGTPDRGKEALQDQEQLGALRTGRHRS